MAKTEVIRLFRETLNNPDVRKQFNTAPSEESFIKMAQDFGYDFSLSEWMDMMRFNVEELDCKLSEIPGI